jgi:GNAT superfamily N-acetyltransferase
MNIRAADPADAQELARVHVRAWQAAYRGMIPRDYLDALEPADRVGRWTERLTTMDNLDPARAGVLVAEADGIMLGFASYGPTRDEDEDPERTGEIPAIYLVEAAWSLGYGRALMATALERLAGAGCTEVTLWVLDANARARRFYEVAGFRADGAVKTDDRGTFQLRELRYRRALP